ncbi:hypothetical protein [Sphingobium sp.]|nr:hypothetical protein [Sphingobium sp.]HUD91477.1 hypothetical protein [Sphingobium sp.]
MDIGDGPILTLFSYAERANLDVAHWYARMLSLDIRDLPIDEA